MNYNFHNQVFHTKDEHHDIIDHIPEFHYQRVATSQPLQENIALGLPAPTLVLDPKRRDHVPNQ